MARTTLTTIKSFIRKNRANLFIKKTSKFDGMTDGVEACKDAGYCPALDADSNQENTLGIHGAWFVFGSRDYFDDSDEDGFKGYKVSNSCGSFTLAIKKEAAR